MKLKPPTGGDKSGQVSHSIIHSISSLKWLIHSKTKQVTVFMKRSLNYQLTQFVKNEDSFIKETSVLLRGIVLWWVFLQKQRIQKILCLKCKHTINLVYLTVL